MGLTFKDFCLELENKIEASYLEGIVAEDAEKLAGQMLYAQMAISKELSKADLNARMRKTGLKSIRAAVYMDAATKPEKKPTETMLASMVDLNDIVQGEQTGLDTAEVERDELERYFSIFQAAHVHFRTIAKGVFNG